MGNTLSSWLRLGGGFVMFGFLTTLCMLVLIPLLPWRIARIKTCNYYGKLTGRLMMWVSGCDMTIVGEENLDASRPAIYVSNHTSLVDAFLAMFLSPVGTVGVVKKQILYYPFFGQMYYLSGHLRIDRGKSEAARQSLADLGDFVKSNHLSIYLWPEGTRSRSGQLLPFKKGIYHLAKQTGLPLVPVVVEGAQKAWVKGSMQVARVPIRITVLPAIDTSGWTDDRIDEHLESVWNQFRETLPEDQQPLAA
ncbi:MAG: 1-acyl-sn-glycerol-3-phosphate acyltransferase [Alphaproteobacteria bacterium]|nr:1-acyl-sn-glycerol-3-phosphate acyltransferase [Alphaproteobacteria bacterium]